MSLMNNTYIIIKFDTKGQLISEEFFLVFKYSKKATNLVLQNFALVETKDKSTKILI